MTRRTKIKLPNGKTVTIPNRKRRKENTMNEKIAIEVFADNMPYSYVLAKSASIETMMKSIECADRMMKQEKNDEDNRR